jgi:hypothetical protein
MRKDLSGTKLLIATPTHGGGMKTEYVTSLSNLLIEAPSHRVAANTCFLQGSVLHKLRNQLLAYFIYAKGTHLLMVDDDGEFDPASILRLLRFDKEFSALAFPFKRNDEQRGFDLNATFGRCPETGMITTNRIGAGLLLLKRSAVLKMMTAYPETKANGFGTRGHQTAKNLKHWENLNPHYFNLFDWGVDNDGTIRPEDYTFCDRWTAIGGKIFIDDSQFTGHVGTHNYKGQLRQFLEELKNNPERFPRFLPTEEQRQLALEEATKQLALEPTEHTRQLKAMT